MIRLMASEFTATWMVPSMRVTGRRTNSMDKVWRHGLTELDMRVSTFKEKSMAKASLLGQMDQLTMVSS